MEKCLIIIITLSLVILVVGGAFFACVMTGNWGSGFYMHESPHSMDGYRMAFLEQRDKMVSEMLHDGEYACCLEKPCIYCIEKTPTHGEGATCHCLADVMNGVHPCGECIGEILEGHGNPLLAPYFGQSIAEEIGMEHLETVQTVIEDKYGIPLREQKTFVE